MNRAFFEIPGDQMGAKKLKPFFADANANAVPPVCRFFTVYEPLKRTQPVKRDYGTCTGGLGAFGSPPPLCDVILSDAKICDMKYG
jgi:hypothetical protein